jgi:hypothetical protein
MPRLWKWALVVHPHCPRRRRSLSMEPSRETHLSVGESRYQAARKRDNRFSWDCGRRACPPIASHRAVFWTVDNGLQMCRVSHFLSSACSLAAMSYGQWSTSTAMGCWARAISPASLMEQWPIPFRTDSMRARSRSPIARPSAVSISASHPSSVLHATVRLVLVTTIAGAPCAGAGMGAGLDQSRATAIPAPASVDRCPSTATVCALVVGSWPKATALETDDSNFGFPKDVLPNPATSRRSPQS